MTNKENSQFNADESPQEPTGWEDMAVPNEAEAEPQADDNQAEGSENEIASESQEGKMKFVSTEDTFNKFMDTIPADVDAAEYIKTPASYLAFMEFLNNTDYSEAGEEAVFDAMYEYSDNFLDHGGTLPSDVDDFFWLWIGLAETLHKRTLARTSYACDAAHHA